MSEQLSLFSNRKPDGMIFSNHYSHENDVTLYHGDRLDMISEIEANNDKATLIVTSPPYNVGKEYEESLTFDDYVDLQRETIKSCVNILADNGSICWQVGSYIKGSKNAKEVFPLDLVLYPIFKSFDLILKNRIIWTFGHGLHEKTRLSGRHETILWFVKSEDYTFNLDPIRVPQKYPGKRSYKGNNKGKPSGNPKGKNPSDVWDIPNVKSNHVEKTEHPCQYPISLVERLILSLTNERDLVVDPYLGAGTTAAISILRNRRVAGSDIDEHYLQIARKRCLQATNGILPYREMNKPVYKPDANNSLASIPEEWLSKSEDTSKE